MNNNNQTFNEKEIKNKLAGFREGSDYSIIRENDGRKIYNFHSDWLRKDFGSNYTTVYEVAENWDSANFNHHREEGKYIDNDSNTEITYRYEHRLNKNGDYHIEWAKSWGDYRPGNGKKHSWTLTGRPAKGQSLISDLKTEHKCLTAKLDHLLARPESEFGNDGKAKKEAEIAAVKKDIDEVASKIEHEKGWLAKNSNFDRQPAKCCNCGFKDIGPSDNYCQECGVALCDKAKKSDLVQENHALRQQLAAVQKQLLEVLTRLEKLEGKDSKKLAQKLSQVQEKNQALIQGDSSPTEIQNQLEQSHNLLNQARADSMISGSSVDNTNDKKANAAAPYLIGGGSLLLVGGLITYYCLRSKRKRL